MSFVDAFNYHLFTIGKTEITVSTLVELAVSAFLLYLVAGRLSRWTLDKALSRSHMEQGQKLAIQGLVHYTILVVGAVVILQNAGINLTAFAIVGSALGVGVGFGLQNIISNFISGLIVLLERPIEIGDRVDVGGVEGVVKEIGARRTTVVTPDRIAILVPNQKFITDNVTNYLYLERTVRLRVPFSIAGGQDVRAVQAMLAEAVGGAATAAGLAAEPKPEVVITSLTAAATALELWVWYDAQTWSRPEVLNRVYGVVLDALAARGIKMA